MADSFIRPLDDQDNLYEYCRREWRNAGIDNFAKPPNESEDTFQQLLNVLPPMNNVIQRRFGYATFVPKLDTGIASGSDQIPSTALYGATFDGEAGYVSTTIDTTWNYNPSFSVEFWFETYSTLGGYFLSVNAAKLVTTSETQEFGVYMTVGGNIGVGYNNSSSIELSATTPLAYNDGKGHHVVVTVNGATIIIYVDGVAVVTTTVTPGSGTTTGYWRLAEGPGGSGWPSGIDDFMQTFLSHVSIFPVVLTSSQVTTHYTAMTSATGSQSIYETAVSADTPSYFWYLTDSLSAPPASTSVIVQSTSDTWTATSSGTHLTTLPLAVSAGHLILVALGFNRGFITGVTDNQSNTYVEVTAASINNNNGFGIQAYYVEAQTSGILELTFTSQAGANGTNHALVFELQNVVVPSPLDGAALATGFINNVNTGTINTADEPDIVFSFVAPNAVPTLTAGQGFILAATSTATNNHNGVTETMASAYRQTSVTGSYSCNWTLNTAGTWCANTIGLVLALPTANVSGNTAYDSADSNIGSYQLDIAPNSISSPSWGGSGTSTVTVVATATAPGIEVGDTGILIIQAAPSTLTVSTVSDSNGNTWTQQTPNGFEYGTSRIFSVWTASMQTAEATGSTFTITVTLSGNCSAIQGSFFNVPDLSAIQITAHSTGTGTGPTSGGVVTSSATALFAFATGADALTGFPTTPWSGTPFLFVNASNGYAVDLAYTAAFGTYIDEWTIGSGAWADFLMAFVTTAGYFLGQYIIVE